MSKIGFIGIGNMGKPMAINLHKAGNEVTVFDVNVDAIRSAAELGLKAGTSVAHTVKDADFVITMLPSSPHVEKLYLGDGQLLTHAPKAALLIDCSTIATAVAQKVATDAASKGFNMLDAPVSGGTNGATAGTLTFMVGGSATNFANAQPIFAKMGKNIFHAGESGAGQTAKMCNNMLLAIHMIGTAEAINLGVNCGMDPKKLCEIMSQSSGRNWSLEVYNPFPGLMPNAPASKNYEGGFAVDLMAKDLGLATEAALATQTSIPLGDSARDLYRIHSRHGAGRLDFSSILEFLQPKKAKSS